MHSYLHFFVNVLHRFALVDNLHRVLASRGSVDAAQAAGVRPVTQQLLAKERKAGTSSLLTGARCQPT